MPRNITCPGCRAALQVQETCLAQAFQCPKCRAKFKVGAPRGSRPAQQKPVVLASRPALPPPVLLADEPPRAARKRPRTRPKKVPDERYDGESPLGEAGPQAVRKAPTGQVASPGWSGKRPRKDRQNPPSGQDKPVQARRNAALSASRI